MKQRNVVQIGVRCTIYHCFPVVLPGHLGGASEQLGVCRSRAAVEFLWEGNATLANNGPALMCASMRVVCTVKW